MTQALTHREGVSLQTIESTREQLDLLTKLVETTLRVDEDYGHIPGTGGNKGTLLKPGAITIAAAFNCHAEPHVDVNIADPTIGKNGFVNYEVHVDLVSNLSGNVMARGFGACNSYEAKYRWRNASPICPTCGKENIRKSNQGDGYYCWRKTDGCGASFALGDPAIESQAIGKTEHTDPLDLANTLLKMAIKRAEVDAAMRLPGVARFFTQDLEDMASPPPPAESSEAAPRGRAAAPAPPRHTTYQQRQATPPRPQQPDTIDGDWSKAPPEQAPAAAQTALAEALDRIRRAPTLDALRALQEEMRREKWGSDGPAVIQAMRDRKAALEAEPLPPDPEGAPAEQEDEAIDLPAFLQAGERPAPQQPTAGTEATRAQVAAIYAIGRKEREWNDEETEAQCATRYGGKRPSELTKREASELIDHLKNAHEEVPA